MVLPEDQEESKPRMYNRSAVLDASLKLGGQAFYQKTALVGATQFEKVNDQHAWPN